MQSDKSLTQTPPRDITLSEPDLAQLENTVRNGLAAFVDVGNALMAIREGKGYKLRGYDTFENYCEEKFGFTDRHGRRMMVAAQTADKVKQVVGAAPVSESVARELAPVADDPKQIEKVDRELKRKGFTVVTATAEKVKEAVAKVMPQTRATVATPGAGKVQVLPGQGPAAVASDEAFDLSFIAQTLIAVRGIFIRTPPPSSATAANVTRALAMINAELKRKREEVDTGAARCPACKKPVSDGDPFCTSCGASL